MSFSFNIIAEIGASLPPTPRSATAVFSFPTATAGLYLSEHFREFEFLSALLLLTEAGTEERLLRPLPFSARPAQSATALPPFPPLFSLFPHPPVFVFFSLPFIVGIDDA